MENGLPVGVASFVGREHERSKLAALVGAARLVTLTGAGGCGKTRLAVEVAGDVAARFADGVRWVDLQGVREPAMVAAAVGAAVGVDPRPGRGLIETLAGELRDWHLLVALDNCEHLVEACAELVADLLSACPRLHVLATSRVPLVVDGEATFEVIGLPAPDHDSSSTSAIASTAAARLFELRARQVGGDFRIIEDNAAAVAEICRRLDGIPLAIELAAARTRVLTPHQIAVGLSDRFGLLTGGVRGAPARQRTLEASLDWSYELLDRGQQLALARLSVFAGSFELDAAGAVVTGEGIDGDEVLDLVAALVAQSLVQVARRGDRARYRLLETIRVYARQRLSELDDPPVVRDRHLAFYVGLTARGKEGFTGGEPEPWVARLAADLDDLRAAADWAIGSGDLQALVDLTEPIVRFWFDRGMSREIHRRLRDAAEMSNISPEGRVRALIAAASLALTACEPASFHRAAILAVDAARDAGENRALAIAVSNRALAGVLTGLATREQVDSDVEEALDVAERAEEATTRVFVLQYVGAARLHGSSIEAGLRHYRESIEVCRVNDLTFHLSAAHGGPGPWLPWLGRLDEARRHAERTVELSKQVGRPGWGAVGLTELAAIATLQGEHDRARDLMASAQQVLRERALEGSLIGVWSRHWRALSAYAAGDLDAARTTAGEIVRIGSGGGSRFDEAVGEWLLGTVAQDDGRHDDARRHLETSRTLSVGPRYPQPLGRSLLGLAALAVGEEDLDTAWGLAHDSLEVLDEYGDRVGAASSLEMVAALAGAFGEPERSLRLLAASQRFHTDNGIDRFGLESRRFDRARATARAALGDTDAAECWDAGGRVSLSEAIAYARRGRGGRQRPQVGWASLTPAEREVVRLVAEGYTNGVIGERLFISVNTVKKHLSRVYAKVDVDGRADLAAQFARRDL